MTDTQSLIIIVLLLALAFTVGWKCGEIIGFIKVISRLRTPHTKQKNNDNDDD